MKSPSNYVDSSATESEEYSESETEDYLKGLGEEQRVCIVVINNVWETLWVFLTP